MSQIPDKEETTSQNMVSNLPLLFSGGYPTSLEKISEKQLENFIPFMVQCSLGVGCNQINDVSEPEWWPEDVPFINPFMRPPTFRDNWLAKMKEIVVICYEFHKSIFLLRFCNELASYERECLRFINNYNSTTSLYERTSNRLLVTFRNENMLYDQQQTNNRRCLLPRTASSQSLDNTPQMVEPALFDIYLCDYCDAELYSLQAYKDHEKVCQSSDDDVIICEPDEIVESPNENHKRLSDFLSNFNLQSNIPAHISSMTTAISKKSVSPQKEILKSPDKYHRRHPRRTRNVLALSRCPNVPFSSPLGQFLIQKSSTISNEYICERLDRIDRFSYAPPVIERGGGGGHGGGGKSNKWLDFKKCAINPIVTFKKTADHAFRSKYHYYNFPRRQFSTLKRDADLEYLNSLLLKRCQPCSVPLKKLSELDVNLYKRKFNLKRLNNHNNNNMISKSSTSSLASSSCKPPTIVEFIDLCSSDEEDHTQKSESTVKSCNGNSGMKSAASTPLSCASASKSSLSATSSSNTAKELNKANKFAAHLVDGNILTIPIESGGNVVGGSMGVPTRTTTQALIVSKTPASLVVSNGDLTLPKPLQPSVFLFSNFNNTNNTFYESINGISNRISNTVAPLNENKMIKFQQAATVVSKTIPSLVRISSNSSSTSQRRSLTVTANL